jgi:putative heme-binding domain-containing protein
MRSKEALVLSVRDPGATVAAGYRPVALQTAEGERLEGVIKSEDAFSIQMMDVGQNLRGFAKPALRRLERAEGSLMPAFGEATLSGQAVQDILAFLDGVAGGENR